MLNELAQEAGLVLKKVSSINGGEFHSACPSCGGSKRFIIQAGRRRYWCRECKVAGDEIQFCRDYLGMSFQEAAARVGKDGAEMSFSRPPVKIQSPTKTWEQKASVFVEASHQRLLIDPKALDLVTARGLAIETIRQYRIGWNPVSLFPPREEWGLESQIIERKEKKMFVPAGLVIPMVSNGRLEKIKIRKSDWKEEDPFGKYHIISGSNDFMPIFGCLDVPVVLIVEAEFDAMLIVQEIGEVYACVALGGAQKRPDRFMCEWLERRLTILFALDFDEAGKTEYAWWQSQFRNLKPWPVPEEKSPGDYFIRGGNLRAWISSGLLQLNGY